MRRAALLGPLFVVLLVAPSVLGSNAPKGDAASDNKPTYITFLNPNLELRGQVTNVTVFFNPKEIGLDKSVPWGHHDPAGDDSPSLEFTAGKPHSLNITLMFDGFETQTNVASMLAKLDKFVAIDNDKRPPKVTFMWGDAHTYEGVIGSLDVKYTLFLEDGTPCRATVTLHMTEASSTTHGHAHGETPGNGTTA